MCFDCQDIDSKICLSPLQGDFARGDLPRLKPGLSFSWPFRPEFSRNHPPQNVQTPDPGRGLGERGQALAAHADRLQHRAIPRRHSPRRLEAQLANPLPQAVELYNIAQDPSEKDNVAAENPENVVALRKHANELAKPLLLEMEFKAIKAMRARLALPPALPDHDFEFDTEQ